LLLPIADVQRQLERALASSSAGEETSPTRRELEEILGEVTEAQSRVTGELRDAWDAWHFYVQAMMLQEPAAAAAVASDPAAGGAVAPPLPRATAHQPPDLDSALIALQERLACEVAPSLAHAALLAELGVLYGELDDRDAALAALANCEHELHALAASPPTGEQIGREVHALIQGLEADRSPHVPAELESVLALHRVYLRLYAGFYAFHRDTNPAAARRYQEKLAAARAAARGGLVESLRRTLEGELS
jgi:hypothetical protein